LGFGICPSFKGHSLSRRAKPVALRFANCCIAVGDRSGVLGFMNSEVLVAVPRAAADS
jgi:hypothetical protein